jgi:hypothetical protein
MMSTSHVLESIIRTSRIVRAGLDIALLVALLGLFMQLTNLSDSHNTHQQRTNYLASALSNTQSRLSGIESIEHVEEFHDSEESMWASFFAWQSKTNYALGNCHFMPPNALYPAKFYMRCTGENAQSSMAINLEPMRILVETTRKQSRFKTDEKQPTTPENSAEPPPVVSGWLETPSGRKHFDPIAQRWTP